MEEHQEEDDEENDMDENHDEAEDDEKDREDADSLPAKGALLLLRSGMGIHA